MDQISPKGGGTRHEIFLLEPALQATLSECPVLQLTGKYHKYGKYGKYGKYELRMNQEPSDL